MSLVPSDEELVQRIGAGQLEAVATLYDRYASVLFPLAVRILHDRAEAEDLVHDAFVAVADRAGQYVAERGAVGPWLITLVRNLAIDRTRRRDRRGALARDVVAHEPIEPVPDAEALTSAAASRAQVRRALSTLPDVQRTTLEIAFFEGLSYPEIAAREGVPLGTIKSRAARAITSLREALVREGFAFEELSLGNVATKKGP